MHRIDTVGATVDHKFKATPAPSTRLGADWHNAIQEEVANVIENAAGGNSALNKADNGQLLTAILAMTNPTKAYVQTVILDENGGNAGGLDYNNPAQLLTAILTMIGRGVAPTKAYVETVITDEDGGDAGLDYGNPGQLLQAIQAMIGRAISAIVGLTAGASGQLAIGGMIVKWGGGSEGNILFEDAYAGAAAFPNACWRVFISLTNDPDDGDESDETVRVTSKAANGFTVATSGDHIAATFDWLAIGN